MQRKILYTIFSTRWGYFGLAATENGLCRTHLPAANPEKVKTHLLADLLNPQYSRGLFNTLQNQITAYFIDRYINFTPDIPLALDGLSSFAASVLAACRAVRFGQTISYSQLAAKIGRPASARAVANILAKNPLPLIIPCHRVIRSDGQIGGFSTAGGPTLKKRLLKHEQRILQA